MGHDFTKGQSGVGDTQLSRPSSCSARLRAVSPFLSQTCSSCGCGWPAGLALPGYNHSSALSLLPNFRHPAGGSGSELRRQSGYSCLQSAHICFKSELRSLLTEVQKGAGQRVTPRRLQGAPKPLGSDGLRPGWFCERWSAGSAAVAPPVSPGQLLALPSGQNPALLSAAFSAGSSGRPACRPGPCRPATREAARLLPGFHTTNLS